MTVKIENIRYVINTIIASFFDIYPGYEVKLKKEAEEYLNIKKQNYSGEEYLDQLEKNSIYQDVLSDEYCMFLAKYIINNDNNINYSSLDEIAYYVKKKCLEMTKCHMDYLRFGCDNCNYHDHKKFSNLKQLRLQNKKKYIKELEFDIVYFRVKLHITSKLFETIIEGTSNKYMSIASKLDIEEVFKEIDKFLNFFTALPLGLLKKA